MCGGWYVLIQDSEEKQQAMVSVEVRRVGVVCGGGGEGKRERGR